MAGPDQPATHADIDALGERLANLIVDTAGQLHTQMQRGFQDVATRFEAQAARMDRQGALIQTGSRWTTRMNAWSERIDQALAERDRQIRALTERIENLEHRLRKGE